MAVPLSRFLSATRHTSQYDPVGSELVQVLALPRHRCTGESVKIIERSLEDI